MSKGETLRALVNERLTVAAQEIFALVEKTIAEYEDELRRSKEENQRKQQLLDKALAPPSAPRRLRNNAPSSSSETPAIDVQIQTETQSGVSLSDVTNVLVKSEGNDTEIGKRSECPPIEMVTLTEICEPESPSEVPVVINDSPQTTNTRSNIDPSNQADTEMTAKTNSGKRKRGRPRRVIGPTVAENILPQPSTQTKDKREELKRIKRLSAETEAHPMRSTQESQSLSDIEGDTTCNKNMDQTPVQSKCPKSKGPKSKRQKPKRQKRKDVLASLGTFVSNKRTSKGMFRCSSCERVFTRVHHLERHILIHTGEKSFTCSVCDKSFRLKQHLMGHMDVHREERRFGCPVCAKKFKRRDNLGRHILVHSGLRPFPCPQCDVQFTLKRNLMRHMIVHTRDVTYCCSVCQMKFSSLYYYHKHVKTHV